MQIEILSPVKAAPLGKAFPHQPGQDRVLAVVPQVDRFIGIDQVVEMTSLAPATIYREAAACRFPRSIRVAAKRVAWSEAEVLAWMRSRIEERAA